MKVISIAALASMLSIVAARDIVYEHPRTLNNLARRGMATLESRQTGNLATFTGALGGIGVTAITCTGDSTRQFDVAGDTFVNFAGAAQRSCDKQHNACANAANAGGQSFTVQDCETQQQTCNTQQTASGGTCSGTTAVAGTSTASTATSATTAAAAASTSASTAANCTTAKRRRAVRV